MSDMLYGLVGSSALADTGLFTDAPLHRQRETLSDPPAKKIEVTLPGVTWVVHLLGGDPVWVYEVLGGIKRLATLPANWDSYGAPPIQAGAIALALDLVGILEGTPHEITHSSPTNDEAILLDTKSGMGIEVSIYGN